jgi:hypothetical protein
MPEKLPQREITQPQQQLSSLSRQRKLAKFLPRQETLAHKKCEEERI